MPDLTYLEGWDVHYAAAAVMLAIYLYNLPLAFAFVWRRHRHGVGVGLLESRYALKNAEKRLARAAKKPARRPEAKKIMAGARTGARLLARSRISHVTARLLIGTGDAARTAAACGGARALANALRLRAGAGTVDIRPDFSGRGLEGEIVIAVKTTPGELIRGRRSG